LHGFRRRNDLRHAAFNIAVFSALLWAGSAAAQDAIGEAKLVENDVRGEIARGAVPIHIGDQVFQSEWVRTGTESLARFALRDETNVSLGPSSQIKLDRFVYEGSGSTASSVVFNATKGAFRFFSGNSPSGAYQVTTPEATLGVRGTIYDMKIEPGRTIVVVQQGIVHVCVRRTNRCKDLTVGGSSIVVNSNTITGPIAPTETPWNFGELCSPQLCNPTQFAELGPSGVGASPIPGPIPGLALVGGAFLADIFLSVDNHQRISPSP
jgi:hypothetical protein